MIQYGEADAAIAGGTESVITPLAVGGFAVMKALSTRNDDPLHASRPWDRDRDGFVIAEGAGIVVLEEMETAKKRGARIYAELVGYGMSGDAYHIAAPSEDGDGPARVMQQLPRGRRASNPEQIDYINAHGTSTPLGDLAETLAIKRVFGDHAQEARRVLDEVHDRPPARRGRRPRDGDLRARRLPRRAFRRRSTTRTRIPSATSTTCRTRRARRRSSTCSRTPSASAAPTAASS